MITVQARPLHSEDNPLENAIPLIQPDMSGEYGIRYLWMRHRFDNEKFTSNYFLNGQQLGMNVRKLTAHAQELWKVHNQKFYDSKENGDLIWRAKAYNKETNTIDYVEVWKNTDTIVRLFEVDRYNDKSDMRDLMATIYDARSFYALTPLNPGYLDYATAPSIALDTGFSAYAWHPYPTISKELSTTYYNHFLDKFNNKDNCTIDTPLR